MSCIRFFKVHGNGNDFIVIDNMDKVLSEQELSSAALALCRRKMSIGADGLLVVEGSDEADFTMRIFNADGSEANMCGNGARALARYAFENGIAGSSMLFKTGAGLMRAEVTPPWVELDMGVVDLSAAVFGNKMNVLGVDYTFSFVSVGVPHCVLLTDDKMTDDLKRTVGRIVRNDTARFPNGTNVSFANLLPLNSALKEIEAVTYERGVEDLTESCGTGCVAVAIAFSNMCGGSFKVCNPGGVNEVRLEFSDDKLNVHAWLKGKTALVASGCVLEEAFV